MPNIPNPYAFIPLRSKPDRSSMDQTYGAKSSLKSGYLDVQLLTKTKLIIPESKPVDPNSEHSVYSFYRLEDGSPIIPGSELRGMLRSVYEAASNSCMGVIFDDKDTRIDMRVPVYAALKNRGLLELRDGVWYLWKTRSYKVPVHDTQEIYNIGNTGRFGKYNPGDAVSFIPNEQYEVEFSTDEQANHGFIQFSYPVNRTTYHPRVLVPCGDEPEFTWSSSEPFDILRHELDHDGDSARRTQTDAAEKVHLKLLKLLNRIKREGIGFIPVWYLVFGEGDKKTCHLSPSAIGRINQVKRWKDMVGDYRPCSSRECSCAACQLFGFIGGQCSAGSRVRVTDAKPMAEIPRDHFAYVTLPILSSPKPSAFEFYVNRPDDNSKYWNYDFYFVPDLTTGNGGEFKSQQILTLRGRKFYWHGVEATAEPAGNQNSTMEALNADQAFCFRVYFDRITQKQLDQLIWTLTLGENETSSLLWHKIGHGRPVGYGSVKLTVDRVVTRSITSENVTMQYRTDCQQVSETQDCPFSKENNVQLQSLLAICCGNARPPEDVRYPIGSDGQIYSWFAENRRARGIQELPAILQTVPSAAEVTYDERLLLTDGETYQGQVKGPSRIKGAWIVAVDQGECTIKISGRQPEARKKIKFTVVKKETSLLGTIYSCKPV